MQNFVQSELCVEVKIQQVYKINSSICVVQAANLEENKKSTRAQIEIFIIDNDLIKSAREIQQLVRNKRQRRKMEHNKLQIDDRTWKWNDEQKKLAEKKDGGRKN